MVCLRVMLSRLLVLFERAVISPSEKYQDLCHSEAGRQAHRFLSSPSTAYASLTA